MSGDLNDPSQRFTIGTYERNIITGTLVRDTILGQAGNDVLMGGAGDDTLDGGTGIDTLTGGTGSDIFRYTDVSDSYRTATQSFADRISDFDVAQDKLDLADMGITGLGDGHHGTVLLAYNAAKDVTYLKNLDADVLGYRFEVVLKGNYLQTLTQDNFQHLIAGTDAVNDILTGTAGADTLDGAAGRDKLDGGAGDDRLNGGPLGDTLTGGAGADTFIFNNVRDSASYGSGSTLRDTITDFNVQDHDLIDLSALGYSGLGNGHNGTLKVVLSGDGLKTAIKSLDPSDRDGQHFEIMLLGNHLHELTGQNVIFGNHGNSVVSYDPYPDTGGSDGSLAAITLVGNAGSPELHA